MTRTRGRGYRTPARRAVQDLPRRARNLRAVTVIVHCPRPTWRFSKAKLSFLVGVGTGYVLGAKAGTERYEQILRAWEQAKDNPQFQSLAGMAQARADGVVNSVKARVGLGSSGPSSTGTGSVPRARSTAATSPASDTPLPPPDIAGGL